jgi:hypothetical protein
MSENAITVVELSTPASEAPARIAAAKEWLLERGIIAPNDRRDGLMQPSEYRAGPKAVDVAPPLARDHIRTLANNGVDFVCERQAHHPIENYEPPPCPSCGVPADAEAHEALVESWLESGEPPFACPAGGAAHPAGDWVAKFTFHVSELAVRFNNWGHLDPSFLAELGAVLGPRARVVYEHS